MGGLFGALSSSLDALQTYQNALNVAQNNVSNASTPGYANQVPTFEALPFEEPGGLTGGVQSGVTQSTDNQYADQAVRTQLEMQGNYTAQSTALSAIQSLFDVTGQTGVIGNLNSLLQSFSSWATTPDSTSSQQSVLSSAQALAQGFQSAAASLSQTTNEINGQISSSVQQINTIAAQIATDNAAIAQSSASPGGPDPGVEANLESSLENLSQIADTTVTFAPNGTATVLLGGQSPLVIGLQQYQIQASFTDPDPGPNANAVPDAHILDANGNDITGDISQGSLAGLLNVRNTVLPSLQGDSNQQGSLNQLAQQVADRVNSILTSSTTPSGQPGVALFTYDATSPTDVAATLELNPNITIGTLAPANTSGSNATALQLSNLGDSTAPADQIGGQTILQFAAGIATQVGQSASNAQTDESLHTTLLSQAQAAQTAISGVSLNAEAVQVLELQQGYQAAGKVITVIDSLASTLMSMITG